MKRLGFEAAEYLSKLADSDDRIWVLDADLADSDGAQMFLNKHPKRYIAAGIAEQNMVTMAAGMATMGKIPVLFSFSAFLVYQAFNQIRTGVAQQDLPVLFLGSHAGGCGGKNGKTHAALSDIALMRTLPNFSVWSPTCVEDLRYAIDTVIAQKKPGYIRLPRDAYSLDIEVAMRPFFWIGKPSRVAIISHGYATQWACEAQHALQAKGCHVGVLHFNQMPLMKSPDLKRVMGSIETALVLEDHYAEGGLYSMLCELQMSTVFSPLAWSSQWSGQSGSTDELRTYYGLSKKHIVEKIYQQTQGGLL